MATYYRSGIKWAKVTGKHGDWNLAMGFKGRIEASEVRRGFNTKKRVESWAREYWLADQPERFKTPVTTEVCDC